jgi:hypothetical protein
MYHRRMRKILALLALMTVMPATVLARHNVVPANPATKDTVQVPLSFISYEQRTGDSVYAAAFGLSVNSWLIGSTLRYNISDKWNDQLLRERGPTDALEFDVVLGNAGNLFSDLKMSELCSRHGIKSEDCVFSNLDAESQATYRKRGPVWDAPLMVLLVMGGSFQQLTLREPADRSVEKSKNMFGARARLGFGGYLGSALLGFSAGAASIGAAPSQVSYCTALAPVGANAGFACAPTYFESYNRTSVLDARLEWRQAIELLGFNPAVQAVFQRSKRDDIATSNDDTQLGLRYIDFELPVYFYVHKEEDPGVYIGLRGVLRWWNVDRSREVDLMGGFFLSLAYGGAELRSDGRRSSSNVASTE